MKKTSLLLLLFLLLSLCGCTKENAENLGNKDSEERQIQEWVIPQNPETLSDIIPTLKEDGCEIGFLCPAEFSSLDFPEFFAVTSEQAGKIKEYLSLYDISGLELATDAGLKTQGPQNYLYIKGENQGFSIFWCPLNSERQYLHIESDTGESADLIGSIPPNTELYNYIIAIRQGGSSVYMSMPSGSQPQELSYNTAGPLLSALKRDAIQSGEIKKGSYDFDCVITVENDPFLKTYIEYELPLTGEENEEEAEQIKLLYTPMSVSDTEYHIDFDELVFMVSDKEGKRYYRTDDYISSLLETAQIAAVSP